MYFKTEAVILKKSNFEEADRILTLYTQGFGKISCIAKGIRRPKSKKAGHLELGNWCKVFVARGKNLDILSEVEVKKPFGINNFSEDKANRIYHFLELVDSTTPKNQKNASVFKLLVNFLSYIENEEDFNLVSSVFKVKLLATLGFFSAKSLKNSSTKKLLQLLEDEDFKNIKSRVKLDSFAYLKLLSFLDSIIENVSETKIKTSRFLNG